jgi:putative Mg2+ transporter-C (MgtC) family protein
MALAAITNFDLVSFTDSAVSLGTAFVLGTLIGIERQYRQRTAGLRTNVLVAVGAAAFVDVGLRLTGADGAVRVLAYVVSGVGFLGAGAIMKEGANIRGLNTAATLWGSAAVGGAAGADLVAESVLIAAAVLASNTMLRPMVDGINRQPLSEASTEATYEVQLTARPDAVAALRERLEDLLDAQNYAVRDSRSVERGEDAVELTLTLAGTSARPAELDAVVAEIIATPGTSHATWAMRTSD